MTIPTEITVIMCKQTLPDPDQKLTIRTKAKIQTINPPCSTTIFVPSYDMQVAVYVFSVDGS